MIDRAEYSIAVLTSLMANIHSKKEFKPEDFLLFRGKEKKDPLAMFREIEAAYNGSNQ